MVAPDGACAGDALRHVPAPLNLEAELDEGTLELSFLVDRYLFRHWTALDARELPDLDDRAYDERCETIAQFLTYSAPVAIDGIDVRPVIEDLGYLEGTEENDFLEFVQIVATYGVKSAPGSIEFNWSRYDTEDEFALESAFLVFSTLDDFQIFELREDAPSQVWTREEERPTVDPEEVRPGLVERNVALSPFSIFAVLIAIVAAAKFRRQGIGVALGCLLVGGAGAVASSKIATFEVPLPGGDRVVLPDEEVATALFETLHLNIYRAFDYKTDSDIYDALIRSLSPELIEPVYREVVAGLVMELEFADKLRCEIRSVKPLESTPELPENPTEAAFDVVARWEVIGTVRHWGHGHWRTNRYSARYRVRWAEEDGWRIGAVEVLDQERLDDGREVAL